MSQQPSPSSTTRLLAVFAHPDDEAFSSAGTFAALSDQGVAITLICATRGEAGEISDPALANSETLGAVREAELRAAMREVGVSDIRLLGFRDSGMVGAKENDDPRAFVNADVGRVAADVVRAIDELAPAAVVSFGPDGIYGHPDHLMAHRVVLEAFRSMAASGRARIPALYFVAVSRERLQERAKSDSGAFAGMTQEQLDRLGTPSAEITTTIRVADQFDRKWAAMMAHRTQMGEKGPFEGMPREQIREFLGQEGYVRQAIGGAPKGSGLLDTLAVTSASG